MSSPSPPPPPPASPAPPSHCCRCLRRKSEYTTPPPPEAAAEKEPAPPSWYKTTFYPFFVGFAFWALLHAEWFAKTSMHTVGGPVRVVQTLINQDHIVPPGAYRPGSYGPTYEWYPSLKTKPQILSLFTHLKYNLGDHPYNYAAEYGSNQRVMCVKVIGCFANPRSVQASENLIPCRCPDGLSVEYYPEWQDIALISEANILNNVFTYTTQRFEGTHTACGIGHQLHS